MTVVTVLAFALKEFYCPFSDEPIHVHVHSTIFYPFIFLRKITAIRIPLAIIYGLRKRYSDYQYIKLYKYCYFNIPTVLNISKLKK